MGLPHRLIEATGDISMGCLGVHFAIDEDQVNTIKSLPTDAERLDYLQEDIEEDYLGNHREWTAESDKAWDAIHRTLTDGTLGWDNGEFPLSHVIFGGESLYEHDDYIMILKTPEQVRAIARALPKVSDEWFREKYFAIDPADYYFQVSEEDFEYTWHWFQGVRDLYTRAAEAGRYVLFTASQ
jgi:hypothetical protein